jgi:uncharacterized protein YjiS (DUF1127 family)
MATAIRTARTSDASLFGQGLSGLRTTLSERFAQYRTYRTTLTELAMLTDRELTDMGLHRANIREIALEAAYKA